MCARWMEIGVSLNNRAVLFLDNYPPHELLRAAELAEELGFNHVWVGDSLIDSPRLEPLATLGAVAARTEEVRIGTSILQPHLRNPIGLALSLATLDMLSKGRLIIGLGLGGGSPSGIEKECKVVGIPKKKRGKIFEESVYILRELLGKGRIDFKGDHYLLEEVNLPYRPIQSPHPPIWIAAGIFHPGRGEVAASPGHYLEREAGRFIGQFERVARLADGWFTIMATPQEYRAAYEEVRRYAKKHGRDPGELISAVEFWINIDEDYERAAAETRLMISGYFGGLGVEEETLNRWSILGPTSRCLEKIDEYREAGMSVLKLVMGSRDQLGMMRRVARELLPSL